MNPVRFVRFVEESEHEDEVWSFWLQLDGNEVAIQELRRLLIQYAVEDNYALYHMKGVPEDDVDVVMFYTIDNNGYMPAENKLVGPMESVVVADKNELRSCLYKGGIQRYFPESHWED